MPTYVANPIEVEALRIIDVEMVPVCQPPLGRWVTTEDNIRRQASTEMCARLEPAVGDYWVVQDDGYTYLNPKAVFERKYSKKGKP